MPPDVHIFDRYVMSATWTVSFRTATFLPHALSGVNPVGLPRSTAQDVPAL
jgi:hypothetical protein